MLGTALTALVILGKRVFSRLFTPQLTVLAAQQDGFDRHMLDLDPSQYSQAAMVSTLILSTSPDS
jgi:hypothetical protein